MIKNFLSKIGVAVAATAGKLKPEILGAITGILIVAILVWVIL
jgi:hypothetical protein|tara:strand:- start:998 stop:1126 length:129 start_codon:yes stop_codon:yes gene_type:complete